MAEFVLSAILGFAYVSSMIRLGESIKNWHR